MYIIEHIAEIIVLLSLVCAGLCDFFKKKYPFDASIVLAILADGLAHYYASTNFTIMHVYKYVIFLSYFVLSYYHNGFNIYKKALFTLSIIGSSMALSLNHLFSIFLCVELSSLPLYLAIYDNNRTDAPRYIMFGMLSTAIEAFGIALIYFATGTMNCFDISTEMAIHPSNLQLIGSCVFFIAFFIKFALFPFQSWLLEIMSFKKYEEGLAVVIAINKLAMLVILARLMAITFYAIDMRFCITVFAAVSMLIASLCAVRTNDIRRLLAYISIEHAAFVIAGLENISEISMKGVFLFIFAEGLAFLGICAIIKGIRRNVTHEVAHIGELRGLGNASPELAIALSCLLISLTGIPPLIGFWGKYYILISLADIRNYTLVVICLISIVISGIYTINLLKNIWLPSETQSFKFDKKVWVVYALAAVSVVLPLLNEKISLLIGDLL